jgi:hypothetical protein
MAIKKDEGNPTVAPAAHTPNPTVSPSDVIAALRALPQEQLAEVLKSAGAAPSTIGMTPELLSTILTQSGAAQAQAMKLVMRRENDKYPERSHFLPRGLYDDAGEPQAPKLTFTRPTFFQEARLGGELETEEEIELCNRFTETRELTAKQWRAEVRQVGGKEQLHITVPSRTVDDRMNLPGEFRLILMELLGGPEAVNPVMLQKQIADLQARVASLQAASSPAA